MPSLMDRVTTFGRSPKGQSLFRQAMSRLTGNDTKKGRRRGGASRRTRTRRTR